MPSKKHVKKQIFEYAAGMGTQLLYVVVIAIVAFIISALALRWF